MADSIWVSILAGGSAGALTGAVASVLVAYLKERWQRGREQQSAVADLHAKIEEVPGLVREFQRAKDPPSRPVDAMDQVDYYAAKERAERRAVEELDRALLSLVNASRRIGQTYVKAAISVRDAARLAAAVDEGGERQMRNQMLEQACERACATGLK